MQIKTFSLKQLKLSKMFSFAIKCDDYFSENNNDNVRDGN